MTHADRKTQRAGDAALKPGDRVHVSSGEVLRWRDRIGTVVVVSEYETRVLLDETPTKDEALVWMRHHHLMRLAPPAEPQEMPCGWCITGVDCPRHPSADEQPTPPSPNAERARAFCAEHRDCNPAGPLVERNLTALLDAVAAEAEARGRAEEQEILAADLLFYADELTGSGRVVHPVHDASDEFLCDTCARAVAAWLKAGGLTWEQRTERATGEDSTKGESK